MTRRLALTAAFVILTTALAALALILTSSESDPSASPTSSNPVEPSTTHSDEQPSSTITPTSGPSESPGPENQPESPIRAAFFYPWFPQAWDQRGVDPFTNYDPSLGRYDSTDEQVIDRQLEMANDAGIEAFISSWWGQGHHTDQALSVLMSRSTASGSPYPNLKWAVYYEPEGEFDPSTDEIVADLKYLQDEYFGQPGYLRVNNQPVIFVWSEGSDGEGMADRWSDAAAALDEDVYLVLKVFPGFRSIRNQPDSWHQYGPASPYEEHLPYSVSVSPGFWLVGESPRLDRDLGRFRADVERMSESGAFWHLITTWNEWGEGTSVEPAVEFGSAYLEALGGVDEGSESRSLTFTAGGDIGATEDTDATMGVLRGRAGRFFLALGDLSYSDLEPEEAWCNYVKGYLGDTFPVQLIVGNHEDDDRADGFIGEFRKCLPDRMGSVGSYGVEYYFDVDALVRIIMIAAGNEVDGVNYDYEIGSARLQWVGEAIDSARESGIPWIIVGMHKPCITAGIKDCEIGEDLMNLLIDKRVDLVLAGHEHNYQRSKQLDCVVTDMYDDGCVVDDGHDDEYARGAGTIMVIAGATGGSSPYPIDRADSEYEYFSVTMGADDPAAGRGFLEIEATLNELSVAFVGTTTDFEDKFIIR